ncbi:hypothetical protein SIID45300_00325 [Candidatus Magnetaquicoccaceae bacterium FCR-1]|uniref:PNPLA domain-containing protein n=1 Tax=Candidatus Magnetaquiglobus chichijimensis TaxID=3141448 RepID=A0ABQ0C564_9PROT
MNGDPKSQTSSLPNQSNATTIDSVIEKEKTLLGVSSDKLIGLGLSGGGIRSAAFNLGVLQGLNQGKWMKKIHYLSTVSGGGYIGAAYSWFTHCDQATPSPTKPDFPFDEPDSSLDGIERRRVNWIRSRGNYLTPTTGLNAWALLAAILRGVLINLIILLPIFWGAVILLSTPIDKQIDWIPSHFRYANCLEISGEPAQTLCPGDTFTQACAKAKNCDRTELNIQQSQKIVVADYFMMAGLAATLILVFLGSLLYAYLSATDRSYETRLWANKRFGQALWLTVGLLLLGSLPFMEQFVSHWFKLTSVAALASAASVAAGWSLRRNNNEGQGWLAQAIVIGTSLLLFLLIVWLYHVAMMLWADGWKGKEISFTLFPLVVSYFAGRANINNVSMHRFYRDRLREAFMPSGAPSELHKPEYPSRDQADSFSLPELGNRKPARPYPIINTTLNTLTSKNPKRAGRGGENFIFSPLYCGSDATGYRRTEAFTDGRFSLATAFTISGAAVDPNTGATRFGPLSFLMTLLNIRLGYWCLNPNPDIHPNHDKRPSTPPWLPSILKELFRHKLDESQQYIHLADGGHFENLAAYELIRRQCALIIIGDAGADPQNTFDSLGNLIQKVRVDFGAEIAIDTAPMRPEDQPESDPPKVSAGKKLCKTPYLIGKITYLDQQEGVLIYINTCLFEELPQCVWTYQRMNKSFPEQTTADQFFDEAQFEAYRELGFHACMRMISETTPRLGEILRQEPGA